MEDNKEEIVDTNNDKYETENQNININTKENIDELPEPEISEEEMKSIINYINTWDFEKYQRDLEVREALLLLRHKMKEEEKEKEKQFNLLKKKETIIPDKNINNDNNQKNIKVLEEEKLEPDNKNNDISINNNINENVFKDELSEKEKELLEKNWNSSTKPEFGEKIVNEKGDKEIIINDDIKNKKVNNIINNIFILQSRKEKKTYKRLENIIYTKPEAIPSYGKYKYIFKYYIIFISIDSPKITIAYDGNFNVCKEKSAEMPFLFSLPEV